MLFTPTRHAAIVDIIHGYKTASRGSDVKAGSGRVKGFARRDGGRRAAGGAISNGRDDFAAVVRVFYIMRNQKQRERER